MTNLGNNLKKILDEKGLKSKYIAQKLNISSSYFSSIVKGKHMPSIELALRLENLLEVPTNKIFYLKNVIDDGGESNGV